MGFNIVDGFLIEYIEEPGVTEVVIPESVTRICQRAFSRCASLISVTIPNGINYHKIRNIQRL